MVRLESKNGAGRASRKPKQQVGERIVSGLKSFVDALEKNEDLSAKFTCHKMVLDLHTVQHDADSVKAIRNLLNVSQTVFAQLLGVKPSTVQSWEQGRQAPGEMACRFLEEIRRDPKYWRARIAKAMRTNVVKLK